MIFYLRLFKEEHEIFFLAFVDKHNLYRKNKEVLWDSLSKEQQDKIKRASMMSMGLQDKTFYKQLNN